MIVFSDFLSFPDPTLERFGRTASFFENPDSKIFNPPLDPLSDSSLVLLHNLSHQYFDLIAGIELESVSVTVYQENLLTNNSFCIFATLLFIVIENTKYKLILSFLEERTTMHDEAILVALPWSKSSRNDRQWVLHAATSILSKLNAAKCFRQRQRLGVPRQRQRIDEPHQKLAKFVVAHGNEKHLKPLFFCLETSLADLVYNQNECYRKKQCAM